MSDPVSTEAQTPPPADDATSSGRTIGWKIIPITVAVIIVLIAAAGGTYLYHHGHAKPKHAIEAVPKTPAKADSFLLPKAVDGLPQSTDEQITSLAGVATRDLQATLSDLAGQPVAGVYSTIPPDAAVLVGLPSAPGDPDAEITRVFQALHTSHFLSIAGLTPVDTGVSGSAMRCSDASLIGGVRVAVGTCVEADSGGSVLLLRMTKSGAATGDLLRSLLPTFETR